MNHLFGKKKERIGELEKRVDERCREENVSQKHSGRGIGEVEETQNKHHCQQDVIIIMMNIPPSTIPTESE